MKNEAKKKKLCPIGEKRVNVLKVWQWELCKRGYFFFALTREPTRRPPPIQFRKREKRSPFSFRTTRHLPVAFHSHDMRLSTPRHNWTIFICKNCTEWSSKISSSFLFLYCWSIIHNHPFGIYILYAMLVYCEYMKRTYCKIYSLDRANGKTLITHIASTTQYLMAIHCCPNISNTDLLVHWIRWYYLHISFQNTF